MPASETEAVSRMLEALKMMPPMMALTMAAPDTWHKSGTKLRPSLPMLPKVRPINTEKSRMPMT